MARRLQQLVPLLRQRELGVQRKRPDAPPHRQHQRPTHPRIGPKIPLGVGASAGWASGVGGVGALGKAGAQPGRALGISAD